MAVLFIGAALVVGAMTGAYAQAKKNPDADNFFQSNSHIVNKDGSSID